MSTKKSHNGTGEIAMYWQINVATVQSGFLQSFPPRVYAEKQSFIGIVQD